MEKAARTLSSVGSRASSLKKAELTMNEYGVRKEVVYIPPTVLALFGGGSFELIRRVARTDIMATTKRQTKLTTPQKNSDLDLVAPAFSSVGPGKGSQRKIETDGLYEYKVDKTGKVVEGVEEVSDCECVSDCVDDGGWQTKPGRNRMAAHRQPATRSSMAADDAAGSATRVGGARVTRSEAAEAATGPGAAKAAGLEAVNAAGRAIVTRPAEPAVTNAAGRASAAGLGKVAGSAAVNGAGRVAAAKPVNAAGSAAVNAAGRVTAAKPVNAAGSAAVNAAGRVTAAKPVIAAGSAAVNAAGRATATGSVKAAGAAGVSAAGRAMAAGPVKAAGSAAINAAGRATAAGPLKAAGQAASNVVGRTGAPATETEAGTRADRAAALLAVRRAEHKAEEVATANRRAEAGERAVAAATVAVPETPTTQQTGYEKDLTVVLELQGTGSVSAMELMRACTCKESGGDEEDEEVFNEKEAEASAESFSGSEGNEEEEEEGMEQEGLCKGAGVAVMADLARAGPPEQEALLAGLGQAELIGSNLGGTVAADMGRRPGGSSGSEEDSELSSAQVPEGAAGSAGADALLGGWHGAVTVVPQTPLGGSSDTDMDLDLVKQVRAGRKHKKRRKS
ncbi:hypothetical protein ABVT39_026396 [Epinephelus coioides]